MQLDTSTDPQVGFRPPGQLDVASALDRYAGHFSVRQAAHLLRRGGFGAAPDEVEALAALGPEGAVDALLHPRTAELDFTDYPSTENLFGKAAAYQTQLWWLDRMLRTRRPLVEKITLFWHGHFATSIRKVPAQLMAQQIDLFRASGLGKFPALLLAVSKNPAMLVWLDNRYNNKVRPNENYAREVMELFALGLGNYTEDDVKSAARAFTGWGLDKDLAFVYRPEQHDDGTKTFLGRTGNWTGEDIVNALVAQPISQRFMARKLLEFFVYSDPEPELIEATAQRYALSGFDIGRTLGTILRSNVFFSQRAYRALPKSPLEYTIGALRTLGVQTVPANLPAVLARMGQEPFAPPSVKGWDGGPTWISTSTLLTRFNFVNALVASTVTPAMARATMVKGAASAAPATAAASRSSGVLTIDGIIAKAGGYDANRVAETIVNATVQDDIEGEARSRLNAFMAGSSATNPQPFGYENYSDRIRGAIALVMNMPVNQLN